MRHLATSKLAAAAVLASVGNVMGQSCIWTQHAQVTSSGIYGSGRAVYHSGLGKVLFLDTYYVTAVRLWAWDGTSWTLLHNNGPSPRQLAAAAYDSARDRLVLFGGYGFPNGPKWPPGLLGDTWEWDRSSWAQTSVSAPAPRYGHAMVYDVARQKTVLFGGNFSQITHYEDTWEWNGQTWTLAANTGPGPRSGPMAFDSVRAKTVLYGATPSSPNDPELWEWDGASWLRRTTSAPGHGMTWMMFDPVRARMILNRFPAPGVTVPGMWELDPATAQWELRAPGVFPLGPAAFDVARSRGVAIGLTPPGTSFVFEYDGAASSVPPYVLQQPVGGSYPVGGTVVLSVQAAGTSLQYQWRHDGQPLSNGGTISGASTGTLTITPAAVGDTAWYDAVISNHCATVFSNSAYVRVGAPPCYPNCDQSTTHPVLNVADFTCFLQRFAARDCYAACAYTCTGHCPGGVCWSVADFTCFLQRYAAGCP